MCLCAAFAVKFQAGEMVLANNTITQENVRIGVLVVATVLRYWHETILYAGTTAPSYYDELQYEPSSTPSYRTNSNTEQVPTLTLHMQKS